MSTPCALSLDRVTLSTVLPDRVEDAHRVQHRPEHEDRDQRHDRQGDRRAGTTASSPTTGRPGPAPAGRAGPAAGRPAAGRGRAGARHGRAAWWPSAGRRALRQAVARSVRACSLVGPLFSRLTRPSRRRPAAGRRLVVRSISSTSSATARSALRAIATTVSSSPSEMNRTPMVTRPVGFDLPHGHPGHTPAGLDREDLVALVDDHGTHQGARGPRRTSSPGCRAAAALDAVLARGRCAWRSRRR